MKFRRILLACALTALTGSALVPLAAPAAASTAPGPSGAVVRAVQDSASKAVTVSGWAYDPQRSGASIEVRLFVDGHYAGRIVANGASTALDRARHISGRHTFRFVRAWTSRAHAVAVMDSRTRTVLARAGARQVAADPGARIVAIAKRYVGHARYVEGGSTPAHGFDCSGYTMYAYAQAHVRNLPHNAEAQRHVRGMHRISRSAARPGDLVFYFSGGPAYHVAIYAGHGMQYAAATVRDGIRYQRIWSSSVEFRTLWH